jgi:FAD/FMN-containing dehydrogenase
MLPIAKTSLDLFAALKGGGNNFGIVTAFTLQTHPMEHDVSTTDASHCKG